ncbi:MAG: DUF5979 domain-containing protein [Coriobacteriia bacterium]|nr:DUF5979 domain-containing protein [Coriobacteriia bacterium]
MKRKFGVKLLLALVLAVALSMMVAAPAMADPTTYPTTPANVVITKQLNAPDGTVVPGFVWGFTINYNPALNTAPGYGAVAGATNPNNTTATASTQPGTISGTTPILGFSGGNLVTQALPPVAPAERAPGEVTFPHAGRFWFEVREVQDVVNPLPPSTDPVPPTGGVITYDTRVIFMLVSVENHAASPGGLRVSGIGVFSESTTTPGTPGDKLNPGDPGSTDWATTGGAFRFTNSYIFTPPGSLEDYALAITKTVDGDYANTLQLFNFTITVRIPALAVNATGAQSFNATIVVPDPGETPPYTIVTETGRTNPVPVSFAANTDTATATFQLRHGEELRFPTLPLGTNYHVTELLTGSADVASYTPRASIFVGNDTTTPTTLVPGPGATNFGPAGEDLRAPAQPTADLTWSNVSGAGRNATEFLNYSERPPITGLFVGSVPFVVALALVTALLAMMVASRSRRRIEELPIAY